MQIANANVSATSLWHYDIKLKNNFMHISVIIIDIENISNTETIILMNTFNLHIHLHFRLVYFV